MLELLKNKRILVVVAHPDDELLGLGATMNMLITSYGVKAKSVILGEGITSRGSKRDVTQWEATLKRHKENLVNAQKAIGYQSFSTYDFPDNRFDGVDLLDIVKAVEAEKEDFKPDVIFTHHGGDTNIDHQKTFEAVITASRPIQGEQVQTIITFETPSSTEWQAFNYKNYFTPNLFIEVDERSLEQKVKGMQCYEYEKRVYPHPRSPEALKVLAKKRGMEVGVQYAEAFMLIRNIARI